MCHLALIGQFLLNLPEFPGLIFKADIERRNSRKKRRSRVIENKLEAEEAVEENAHEEALPVEETEIEGSLKKDKFYEVKLVDTDLSVTLKENRKSSSKTNTLKRRSSKKKKVSIEIKFNDDIDQALHEIMILEEEEKRKLSMESQIKSKRPSKKGKQRKEAYLPKQKYADYGDADDEFEVDFKQTETSNTDKQVKNITNISIPDKYIQQEDTGEHEDDSSNSSEILCLEEDKVSPTNGHHRNLIVSPLGIQEDLKEMCHLALIGQFLLNLPEFQEGIQLSFYGDHW